LTTYALNSPKPWNLFVDPSKLEEFVHIDDEDNEEYATTVLEDVEELLGSRDRLRKNLGQQIQYIMASNVASRGSKKNSGFQSFLRCRAYKMVFPRQYGGCRVHCRKSSPEFCDVS